VLFIGEEMNYSDVLLIDESVFKKARSFMNVKFPKIIGYYFEDTQSYIDTIEKSIIDQDIGMIIPAAHTIKSSSKQLGAERLSLAAAHLEEAARLYTQGQGDDKQVYTLASGISLIFADTQHSIKYIMISEN
jgi:HPt (histidine-containing phosphotransfer) domain-containing protein